MDVVSPINYDKGFVIRCVDSMSGRVMYRGANKKISFIKDSFREKDTFTISGAWRALRNFERMYPDEAFYSIEKISSHYFINEDKSNPSKGASDKKALLEDIEKAMIRLDELWEGNDFDKGDKMRINNVRYALNEIKEYLMDADEKNAISQ